jgi:hypothetical protein
VALVSRRSVALVVVGWLLGVLTAFGWPAVSAERQTVVVLYSGGAINSTREIASLTGGGWVVTRTDRARETPIVQLERPRYLRVYEDLRERPRGSWCWLTTGDWYC